MHPVRRPSPGKASAQPTGNAFAIQCRATARTISFHASPPPRGEGYQGQKPLASQVDGAMPSAARSSAAMSMRLHR
jgi:hypothetical protein